MGTLVKNQTPAVMTLAIRGRGNSSDLEAREDGTANALLAPNGGRGGIGCGAIANPQADGIAVRRLTPVECERLQGFPEIVKTCIIEVCFENPMNSAHVVQLSHRSPKCAYSAGANALPRPVNIAESNLPTSPQDLDKPVALNVLIDLERNLVQARSHGKSLWSVSNAEQQKKSPLRIPVENFVLLVAHIVTTPESVIIAGAGESRTPTEPSLVAQSGSKFVTVSGQEIEGLAGDAGKLTMALGVCMKSITLPVGQNSLSLDALLKTWCCCVIAAISSSIPEQTLDGNSYYIKLTTTSGYTRISAKTADGPRYRALGNSMAVPVMRWIGRRIQESQNALR